MHPPAHDPSAIYRYRDSVAAADCLCAAVADLDLFTLLDRQPGDLAAVCKALGLHARPADAMLTLFAANGFVERDAAGVFRTSPLGREFLVAGAPFDARPYYTSMAGKPGVAEWLKVLRSGKPANWPGERRLAPAPPPELRETKRISRVRDGPEDAHRIPMIV